MVTMSSKASKPESNWSTPLECLLPSLKNLRLTGYVWPERLTLLCSEAWPQYPLDNDSHWPPSGTLDFDVLRDLGNYCRRTGKWSVVPFLQAFWALFSRPTLCTTCSPTPIMLTMAPKQPACPKPDPPLKESPGPESSAFSIPPEDLAGPQPYAPLTPAAPSPTPTPLAAPTTPPHTSSIDTQPTKTIHPLLLPFSILHFLP